ncbi:MAG TPA: VCBS repeat-containing protein [Candidatus Limnocylindrales bacterium]|nr:VCBS repeat-containing protein [Candidatus Limnocylindrales bacterium]
MTERHQRTAMMRLAAQAVAIMLLATTLVLVAQASAAEASAVDGRITRAEILQRADYWYRQGYVRDVDVYYPDPSGRLYRSDCSGLVSMAWHLSTSRSTATLPEVATRITVAQLQAGDILLAQKDANNDTGHTAIFVKWADTARTQYWGYDHGGGPIKYQVYGVQRNGDSRTYLPYRYEKVLPSGELVTGRQLDFNGDGRTDVFTITADSKWIYKSGGQGSWITLDSQGSTMTLAGARFGDFNGDGRTDVFTVANDRMIYMSGGQAPWIALASTTMTLAGARFGDFNGDGNTDVFTIVDNRWVYMSAGQAPWITLDSQGSTMALTAARFGDFNAAYIPF